MRRNLTHALLGLIAAGGAGDAHGSYLFASDDFTVPAFASQQLAEYSEWNTFYSAHTAANFPDVAAPHGGIYNGSFWEPVQRSIAGFPSQPSYNPTDPLAFWDTKNPTIAQTGTTTAFIIGPDSAGNIYSWAAPTKYTLSDSTADATTPYTLGTVQFQFQTDGTLVDFDSIKLRYTDATGAHEISATDYVREYIGSSSADPSAANAFTNRVALQWNLSGLGITSYQIVWNSLSSSMSFQRAVLDTAAVYGEGVPAGRTWTAAAGLWSGATNWAQGSSSIANGNVTFANTAAAVVTLDGNRTIGEMIFNSPAGATITAQGAGRIVANTGISTAATATGTYTIDAPWQFGSTNLFEIRAGTVRLGGVVSGSYGLLKKGDGALVLAGSNTFTGGLTIWGGTVRIEGSNAHAGGTALITGRLEIASNSPRGAAGALGLSTEAVSLGADGSFFQYVGGGPAEMFIDGDFTVGQDILLAQGDFQKRLGAFDTTTGATYSGRIDFGTPEPPDPIYNPSGGIAANNVRFTAGGAGDRLVFSGAIVGGKTANTLTLDGAGTVVYSGTAKTYANSTTIASGTLEIATSATGDGAWQVNDGAILRVNGTLGGAGALTLSGGTLTGSGFVNKSVTLDDGDRLAPGHGVGTLTLAGSQIWSGGAVFEWQIGSATGTAGVDWDLLAIDGPLHLDASAADRIMLVLSRPGGGLPAGFDPGLEYEWIFATADEGISQFLANGFQIDASALGGMGDFYVSNEGDSLILNYAPVPEPGTVGLLLTGACAWWFARRRCN